MPRSKEAIRKATSKYKSEKIESLNASVEKGKRDILKAHAADAGDPSLNAFVNRSITETVERDSRTQSFERMFGMKTVTANEYEANLQDIHARILGLGDIFCIDGGNDARLVIMEEPQYHVMRDALKTIFAAASMDENTFSAILAATEKAGIKPSE